MAKYQKYAEYKDSGVEWLGEIPNDWINTKVKYEAYVKARVGWHGLKSDDFTDEGPYLVTGSDFKGTNIDWSQCYHCDLPRYEQDPYIQLKDGDLLITKDGTIGKVALVSNLKDDEKATLNSGIFVVRPLRNNFSTKFYFWLLQSKVFKEFVDFNKTGSTIVHLYQDTFVNFEYASPVLEDQIKISNFLDHETIKIDHLIEKQQQLIELLKEKRQAVISHAVTKGLNPNVPMKDSGVAWLGEVPEHWDIKKIKYLGSILNGYAFPSDGFTEEGIKVLKISNIQTMYLDWTDLSFVNENQAKKLEQFLVKKGDLVFALTRPIISTGIKATLMDLDEKILLNQRNAILRPNGLCIQKWLYYMILNQNFVQEFNNQIDKTGQQPNISTVAIGNLEISVAPIEEQIKIVEFIAEKVERIDDLIKKAESAIQLMQERRTALISAAVTGKIDVRHWQAPNVTEADTELSA
ncbi:restriction endonuclease subunit S [Acinetobacter sp. IK22]|uniref:restriction endonuclease subunit S n=1 Tax=Acinetobacter TaxID=469 RepID=UPI000D1D94DA|nr:MULTISPECIES: restriction endonuclease subunit S [Acinetobacter]MEB3795620.1 restriction endonuclease subunit S [Acinetobacter sp. IK24]MEB3814769.1 restriction endonuclease subunit S [Acinetobacter sp. IK22]MEB3833978.1 restriction endonuclease subunit S [Acinetobacter sp. IK23]